MWGGWYSLGCMWLRPNWVSLGLGGHVGATYLGPSSLGMRSWMRRREEPAE